MNLKLLFKKNVLKKKIELECGGGVTGWHIQGPITTFIWLGMESLAVLDRATRPLLPFCP